MNDASETKTLYTLSGELDLQSVPRWDEELDAACSRRGAVVQLDLSDVSFIDSTGLRMLVRLRRLSEAAAGTLILLDPPAQALSVLEMAGLTDHFRIDTT
ncbi:MAG: STAS domain-containing protein [Acidimicrobiales bacterium]|nr:STAS domain-containing protein [Acidimicrobiales bacterium]